MSEDRSDARVGTLPGAAANMSGRGEIALRAACTEDADALYEWANDPAARADSFDREPIPWPTHVAWLAKVLGDQDCRLWIAEESGIPVGQVRIDRTPDGVGVVSIGLAANVRGRGVGRRVLRLGLDAAIRELGIRRARAVMLETELPSRRLFEGSGFAIVHGSSAPRTTSAIVMEADLDPIQGWAELA
jgi:UDP-2,4-diacetamido-2,4,6-trideoxy-beta-L-altropyranose hydrolase